MDRTKLVVRTTSTRQVRRVALDPLGRAVWENHRGQVEERAKQAELDLAPDGYVLTFDLTGREPLKPDTATESFRRLARKVGVKVRFHDLRHFSATRLIAAGVDVRTVAGRLGHANPSTTLRVYSHTLEQRDRLGPDLGPSRGPHIDRKVELYDSDTCGAAGTRMYVQRRGSWQGASTGSSIRTVPLIPAPMIRVEKVIVKTLGQPCDRR